MPYNTRRKSLSLPSLGIHVPSSSRRSKASNPASATPSSASTTNNSSSSTSSHLLPPNKKLKRSDPNGSSRSSSRKSPHDSPGSNDENGNDTDGASMGNLKLRRSYGDYTTPPPSPGSKTDCDNRERCGAVAPPGDHRLNEHKDIPHLNPVNRSFSTSQNIDRSAINDDIVVAVIEQLEVTGNRPHLIKELATALACKNETIANSANAAALLSSRLSLFLKRSWSSKNPCPIEKQLIPVHPRKVFFYLTTCPQLMTIEESHKNMFNGEQSQEQERQGDRLDNIGDTVQRETFGSQLQPHHPNNLPVLPSPAPGTSALKNKKPFVSFDHERERSRYSPSPELGFNLDLSDPMFDEDDEGTDEESDAMTRDSNIEARDNVYSRRAAPRRLRFPSTSRFSDFVTHQRTSSSHTSTRVPSMSRGVTSSTIGGHTFSAGGNAHAVRHFSQGHHDRAMSPLLEGDEEEFTQVATAVRERASNTGTPQTTAESHSHPSLGQLESGASGAETTGIDNDINGFIMDGFPVSPNDVDVFAGNRRLFASPTNAHTDSSEKPRAEASGPVVPSPSPSLSGSVASATDDSEVSTMTTPMETDNEGGRDRDRESVTLREGADSGLRPAKPEPRGKPRGQEQSSTPLKSKLEASSHSRRPFNSTGSRGPLSMISPSRPGSAPLNMHMFCAGTPFDMGMEGWKDLKSPENVDVDELDAYFNEVP